VVFVSLCLKAAIIPFVRLDEAWSMCLCVFSCADYTVTSCNKKPSCC